MNTRNLARVHPRWSCISVWTLAAILGATSNAVAQSAEEDPSEKPGPVTTSDPAVPVEDLELLVKPLTKEELIVEADGWRDLFKGCVQKIAQVRIAAKHQPDPE